MNALLQGVSSRSSGVRFAPSPTGRFHVGNLRTAWISWWLSRQSARPWVVRFEDIDAPRVQAGAQSRQLEDLRALGLVPDEIRVQSQSYERHLEVFNRGVATGQLYPCTCSRKEVQDALAQHASAPHSPNASAPLYSGHCRELAHERASSHPTVAWRFRMEDASGSRDFIVGRVDGEKFTPAYHWACAIDDADGGYALLVRAWDLAPVLEQQRAIQRWMGAVVPEVFHCSLVVTDSGGRLEKRTRGVTLEELVDQGVSRAEIVEQFQSSFEVPNRSGADGLWGEVAREISLQNLGIAGGRRF
jgi:glutamyl-tRNA synthetase